MKLVIQNIKGKRKQQVISERKKQIQLVTCTKQRNKFIDCINW